MAGTIAFTEVDVSEEGEIRCRVHRGDRADELRFALPHAFAPAPDLVASAFATLCGTGFDRVRIDLPLGPRTRGRLEEALATPIDSGDGTDVDREPGRRHILNFSGGFDSLAARAVLPEADLVSLDFGGRFARERPLFERFRPHIVETNLVDLGLNRNHWSFMGVGAILLRDELDLGTYSFGSVQAGSLPKLFTGPVDQHRTRMAAAPDMRIMNPVSGLCEIGAMTVAVQNEPELPVRVLESVAHPGETKYHRKHLMLRAVAARLGLDLTLPPAAPPRTLSRWGGELRRRPVRPVLPAGPRPGGGDRRLRRRDPGDGRRADHPDRPLVHGAVQPPRPCRTPAGDPGRPARTSDPPRRPPLRAHGLALRRDGDEGDPQHPLTASGRVPPTAPSG